MQPLQWRANDEAYMNKHNEQHPDDHSNKVDIKAKTEAVSAKHTADAKAVKAAPVSSSQKKWPQQVKAAKSTWGKLSEAELLESDGNAAELSGLVQKRYHIASDVADKQVKTFLAQCHM